MRAEVEAEVEAVAKAAQEAVEVGEAPEGGGRDDTGERCKRPCKYGGLQGGGPRQY